MNIAVVAVDPAYTSKWGAGHWLAALRQASPHASGHHAAALVIGRRALGQRARRRERCDWRRPEDRQQRATDSAVRPAPAPAGLTQPRTRKPGTRTAHGQPRERRKTPTANRAPPGNQVAEDRSPPPTGQGLAPAQWLGTVAEGRGLPGELAGVLLEGACRAVRADGGHADEDLCALLDGPAAAGGEVGGGVAGLPALSNSPASCPSPALASASCGPATTCEVGKAPPCASTTRRSANSA
jgi:hypothetical protein